MSNVKKDVTVFGTDVINRAKILNKVSFRICKKPTYMIRVNINTWPMMYIRRSLIDNTYTCMPFYKGNGTTFRICRNYKRKRWYDNIRNYFNRRFNLANR